MNAPDSCEKLHAVHIGHPHVRNNDRIRTRLGNQFKAFFLSHFGSLAAVSSIDWDLWLYSPGLPPYKPDYDTSLAKAAWSLALAWQQWQHTPGGRQAPG